MYRDLSVRYLCV